MSSGFNGGHKASNNSANFSTSLMAWKNHPRMDSDSQVIKDCGSHHVIWNGTKKSSQNFSHKRVFLGLGVVGGKDQLSCHSPRPLVIKTGILVICLAS